jgi:hypothetical protein
MRAGPDPRGAACGVCAIEVCARVRNGVCGGGPADMKERIGGLQQWLAGHRRHLRVCDVDNCNGRREQVAP